MKSKVLPVVMLAVVLFFALAGNVHAASQSYAVRSEGCHTYNLYAHQEDKPIEGESCGQIQPTEERKVKHSEAMPAVLTMTPEQPVETVIVIPSPTPSPVTPEPTEPPAVPTACQDDEDDGIGEDDSVDDKEPEDCEDEDDSQ